MDVGDVHQRHVAGGFEAEDIRLAEALLRGQPAERPAGSANERGGGKARLNEFPA